ncbi:hypothetical protein HK097_005462, partial [Rhizophlyctis rosea]
MLRASIHKVLRPATTRAVLTSSLNPRAAPSLLSLSGPQIRSLSNTLKCLAEATAPPSQPSSPTNASPLRQPAPAPKIDAAPSPTAASTQPTTPSTSSSSSAAPLAIESEGEDEERQRHSVPTPDAPIEKTGSALDDALSSVLGAETATPGKERLIKVNLSEGPIGKDSQLDLTDRAVLKKAKDAAAKAGVRAGETVAKTVEGAREEVKPVVEKAKDVAQKVVETAKVGVETVIEESKEVAHKVAEAAQPVVEKVKEVAEAVVEQTQAAGEREVEANQEVVQKVASVPSADPASTTPSPSTVAPVAASFDSVLKHG